MWLATKTLLQGSGGSTVALTALHWDGAIACSMLCHCSKPCTWGELAALCGVCPFSSSHSYEGRNPGGNGGTQAPLKPGLSDT